MKKLYVILLLLCFFTTKAQTIIPEPLSLIQKEDSFTFNSKTIIFYTDDEVRDEVQYLANMFAVTSNFVLKTTKRVSKNRVSRNVVKMYVDPELISLGNEGYELDISPKQIIIKAAKTAGLFYACQTIKQLLPAGIDTAYSVKKVSLTVPCLEVKDMPRFSWRAYMLDESRYFQGEFCVKRILNEMALLKMNIFHWHLTDDAGWRIEIKKYPKLTSVGAYRKDSQISNGKKWKSTDYSGMPHGGFYTQKQIRDIIAYATERHIEVIPEIEIPGHSSAAIAAYPWVGTMKEPQEVPVKFGKRKDIYDPSSNKTKEFLENVLTEVFELFPSKIVHIGGDEVGYDAWKESKNVIALMKEKGLKSPVDVQIYFTNRISEFIENNGKRMIGWNEVMGGNVHKWQKSEDVEANTKLAKNTIIQFWKGNLELIEKAAKKGHYIVNSHNKDTYLDYNYKKLSLEKAYDFDPIPAGLPKKYHSKVYGFGTQMWTEWTPTNKDVEYQTFPRIAAYAEVGWTNKSKKNFKNFKTALNRVSKRWDLLGINYAKNEK